MDNFFLQALLAGTILALAAGPLGSVMIWRRMVYFGAAVSHSALLGVAFGLLLGIAPSWGILLFCLLSGAGLYLLENNRRLSNETLLGILAHAALAAGLVIVSMLDNVRVDLMAYLFGDILALGPTDLWLVGGVSAMVLAILLRLWRPLLSVTANREIARVEGVHVDRVNLAYVLLLATLIAVGMKVIGIMLIVSLLLIPAAAARHLAGTPEQMAVIASGFGVISVALGMYASFQWDLPSGPAIVLAATAIFIVVALLWRTE
jgi:zinc transport system permease protein